MKNIGIVLGIAFILLSIYGWVNNIIIICHSNFDTITGLLVARCFGVFVAPLGVVLGFIN